MASRGSRLTTVLAALVTGIAGFQAALAAGVPWGRVAWGGTHPGTLPAGYRAASAVAACVWLAVAAGLVSPRVGPTGRRRLVTGLVVVGTLAVVANGASRSAPERAVWTPYALVMLGCAWLLRRELRTTPQAGLSSSRRAPSARRRPRSSRRR
jgi:hypothetical protein